MNINDRIVINDNELFQYLESRLDSLQPFVYDTKYKMLLGDSIIKKLNTWSCDIRKQKDVPLTVVVCGEFKRGKSSLINSILGEDVVTTNITTETITVNRISYGEHSNEIILKGGRRIRLTDDELNCDKLKEIIGSLPENDKITMLELKRPIDILKDITIIDTPGLGDSIKDFTAEVDYALKMADVVIYVFSVLYPLSTNEQFFIKTAIKPQKYTDLILIGNYCDQFESEQDIARMTETIRGRIKDILPGETPLMVSALDERCRQLNKSVPNEALSECLFENFNQLRTRFNDVLTSKRGIILPDRIQRMINAMVSDLQKDIDSINLGLSLSTEELNKKREEVTQTKIEQSNQQSKIFETIDKFIEIYKAKAIGWLSDFIGCMEKDIGNLNSADLDDIKKYYPIFCVETLQTAINKCNEYFTEALYDELEKVSAEITKKLSMSSSDKKINLSFALNNKVWTKGDNLNFAGTFVLNGLTNLYDPNTAAGAAMIGTFSLISNVFSFATGAVREHELKGKAPDIIKNIREQYPELRKSIIPAISENYKTIGDAAKKQLVEYFGEKNDELEDLLKQSETIVRQDSEKKAEIEAAVKEITAILENIENDLKI